MAKSLGAVRSQTAKHPGAKLADPRQSAIACCFLSRTNLSMHPTASQGGLDTTHLHEVINHAAGSGLVSEDAQGIRGSAAAQEPKAKASCPSRSSSRSAHTEMPVHFQNQILHDTTEQKATFFFAFWASSLSLLQRDNL